MQAAQSNRRPAVLVVEDEPILRLTACDMVEEAGYEAVEAADADAAVGILEARPDIRVVLTDVAMPGSMTGVELATTVRRRWPPVEIIVVSAYDPPVAADLPARCLFFAKPYRERDVVAAMRRMVA